MFPKAPSSANTPECHVLKSSVTETRLSRKCGRPGPEQVAVGQLLVENHGAPTPPPMGLKELTHLAGIGNVPLLMHPRAVLSSRGAA